MPTVKNYGVPRVENEGLRGGERTAFKTEEAYGAATGKAMQVFGLKLHEDEVLRQDQVALMEADRKLGEWENNALYHPQTGALSRRGKDAFSAPDEVSKSMKAASEGIRGELSNDRQRAAFDRAYIARQGDINKTMSRHVFTEARKYEEVETEAYVKNAQQSAILNYQDPERVGLEIEKARGAVIGFARRNGLGGSEYEKQKLRQVESDVHVNIIERYLSNGQDQSARRYFEQAKKDDRIAGDDIKGVEAKIKTAVVEGEGLRGSDDIWQRLGPKNDADPVNIDQMVKEAESKHANNPSVLKAVKDQIKEKAALHNASQRERQEAAADDVWKAIEGGASFTSVRSRPAFRMLPGRQQNEIKTWMIDRADTMKKRAEGDGDDTLYYNLMTEASTAALQDKFLTTNLQESRGKLSKQQFNHLVDIQANLRKGDTKNADKLMASERVQKSIVDEALLSMKLDPTPNEKTSKDKVDQINGFRRSVREAVSAQEARTGKNATDKDVQSIVDGLIIKGVTEKGVLWDTTKRVYELKPGENITIKVTDVPREERAKIEDTLRRNKKPVTDETVTELYRAKLIRLRGSDAPDRGRIK